jgi:hypothetical protein
VLRQDVDHRSLDTGGRRRAAGCDQAQGGALSLIDVRVAFTSAPAAISISARSALFVGESCR